MRCPYCQTENAPGAIRCAACTSWMTERPPVREWTRARSGRMIAGVARGLSNRFGIACAAVRLAFLLGVLCGGWGLILYVAMWIAMPEEPHLLPAANVPEPPPGAEPRAAGGG
jgi:phage shock protein PspC (stress-responsive transcriptional regulator)